MNSDKEIIPGLSAAEVEEITDKIFSRNDTNHPLSNNKSSGFVDILENAKPNISASSIFIKKVSL